MRSIYIALVFLTFMALGVSAPFVFSLGYVWVDAFVPQNLSYFLLSSLPCALIMGVCALGSYFLLDRRSPPPVTASIVLTGLFAIWVTLTTLWAEVPDAAWFKWGWAFKTIAFSAFLPFVFRSRVQIEAFLYVWLFSLGVHMITFGAKTVLSGGGYGSDLGVLSGNSGLAEGGFLSAAAAMMIPLFLYLKAHGQLLPKSRLVDILHYAMIVACIATAVGTYERSAMIGLAVVAGSIWISSKRKALFAIIALGVIVLIAFNASKQWNERMSTIDTYQQDTSALGRILVWEWTLGYVIEHPYGGGFDAFRINRIELPPDHEGGEKIVLFAKAYHSIYFEVLGEQGWIGFGLFGGLIFVTLRSLRRVVRRTKKDPELAWCADLGRAMISALLAALACGAFVGLAYQQIYWYLFAGATCLSAYLYQAERARNPVRRWRQAAAPAPAALLKSLVR